MVGCGDTSFDLDTYDSGQRQPDEELLYKEHVNLKANKWYTDNVDMANCGGQKILTNSFWDFAITHGLTPTSLTAEIIDAKVWIDGNQLIKINQPESETEIKTNEFAICKRSTEFATYYMLTGGIGSLTNSSKIKIEFTIGESYNDFTLMFKFDVS